MTARRCHGWALAAAAALLTACASDPLAPPAAVELRPVLRSTLVSMPELRFSTARWHVDGSATTVLLRQQGTDAPVAVARLVESHDGEQASWTIQHREPAGFGARDVALELATIEQLYAFVLRLEPQARYCVGSTRQPCDVALDGGSHESALRSLVLMRERLQRFTAPGVVWHTVRMEAAPEPVRDVDVVGVRAIGPAGPMAGVDVFFNRAPHSTCVARTRADGVARCRLVDQHGDGHEHDHSAAVVVTYPGDVRSDRILLPTTHVLPVAAPGRTAFARPFVPFGAAAPGRP